MKLVKRAAYLRQNQRRKCIYYWQRMPTAYWSLPSAQPHPRILQRPRLLSLTLHIQYPKLHSSYFNWAVLVTRCLPWRHSPLKTHTTFSSWAISWTILFGVSNSCMICIVRAFHTFTTPPESPDNTYAVSNNTACYFVPMNDQACKWCKLWTSCDQWAFHEVTGTTCG